MYNVMLNFSVIKKIAATVLITYLFDKNLLLFYATNFWYPKFSLQGLSKMNANILSPSLRSPSQSRSWSLFTI